jgi:hypothetical protein
MDPIHRQSFKEGKREGFIKGKKAGIWLSYNYIFPIRLEAMNKDLVRVVSAKLRIPNYSNMSQNQLLQSIRDLGYNKIAFKENNGNIQIIPS